MPSRFASAARHLCETANCSLCKIRHLFVVQLETLQICMWRDSCFAKAVTVPSFGGRHKFCMPVLQTGLVWAKSKPWGFSWHWDKAINCVGHRVLHWAWCCADVFSVSQVLNTSAVCALLAKHHEDITCVELLRAEQEQGQGRFWSSQSCEKMLTQVLLGLRMQSRCSMQGALQTVMLGRAQVQFLSFAERMPVCKAFHWNSKEKKLAFRQQVF